MDLLLIEISLWIGLLFFLWALKDGLSSVESDMESARLAGKLARAPASKKLVFYRPEQVSEVIGSYQGESIYRYVVIGGQPYEFDRVRPIGSTMPVDTDERYVHPGLVYQERASGARP